jgi:hypothetical protein
VILFSVNATASFTVLADVENPGEIRAKLRELCRIQESNEFDQDVYSIRNCEVQQI